MRSSKSRSRNKSNRQRTLGNVVNRVFDSSGPEGKVRGTPQQIIEKYLQLARDAQLSNDRVAEQSFLQHAEHYTRMLGEAMREQAERQQQQPWAANGNQGGQRDDDGDSGQSHQGQGQQNQQHQPRRDDDRGERQDRAERNDRDRGDRDRGDRDRSDRDRNDRDRNDRDRNDRNDRDRGNRQPRRDDQRRDDAAGQQDDNRPVAADEAAAEGSVPWQGWAARAPEAGAGLPDALGGTDDHGPVQLPEDNAQPAAEATPADDTRAKDAASEPAATDPADSGPAGDAPARSRAPRNPAAPRRTRKPATASNPAAAQPQDQATSE